MKYKIKDNVDLKELEKFGYSVDVDIGMYTKYINTYCLIIDTNKVIIKFDRGIYTLFIINENDIQDLIKADLVEECND